MPKVYVSSTFGDLRDHRKRIELALRRMRLDVEAYVAESIEPLEKCLADIAACDLYVGVFAWHYGARPPGERRSFTECEYRAAVAAGKATTDLHPGRGRPPGPARGWTGAAMPTRSSACVRN